MPAIVVSNLAAGRVVHHGPFEHTSTLKLIESTFGLQPLTARDANAENLGQVLRPPRRRVPAGVIPTSAQVLGPANDAAAVCSATSVQSVSPEPVRRSARATSRHAVLPQSGSPTGSGMVGLGRQLHKHH